MRSLRRLTALGAGLAVAVTTVVATAGPAAADEPGVTGYSVSNAVVSSSGTVNIPVEAQGAPSGYGFSVPVTFPNGTVADYGLYLSASDGFKSIYHVYGSSAQFGKYTLGTGASQTAFYVRAASALTFKAEHFNKKKTTFRVKAANFDYTSGNYSNDYYVPLKAGTVKVQRLDGSSWTTVATLKVKKGSASKTMKVAKAKKYRAVYSGTSAIAPSVTKAVKVTKVKTATTIKATTGAIGKAKLAIKVTPKTAKGSITVLDGKRVLKKLALNKKGKAVYKIPSGMKKGAHTFVAKFVPAKKKFVKASKAKFAGVIY